MIAARFIAFSGLALGVATTACSGGDRASERAPAERVPTLGARGETLSAIAGGDPALGDVVAPAGPPAPTTSIALVDAFPAEVDLPVVPAADAHDAVLPPGVLPDDFAIVVRPRIGAAPFVELRPRAGMAGRWELVAADAETPDDPSVDLSESLVWSVEVPVRRVAGLYSFLRAHDDTLSCDTSAGLSTRYSRRSLHVACDGGPAALALRARMDQIVTDLAP